METGSGPVVARGRGRGEVGEEGVRSDCFVGTRFSPGVLMKMFWNEKT